MSRWQHHSECPPPLAFELIERVAEKLAESGVLKGSAWLGTNPVIYAGEEEPEKPKNGRWVLITEAQEIGGKRVSPSGLLHVEIHVKVVSPRVMRDTKGKLQSARWHSMIHRRIAQEIIGMKPLLSTGTVGVAIRQTHEPSPPIYYANTDSRESFARYMGTLQSLDLSQPEPNP